MLSSSLASLPFQSLISFSLLIVPALLILQEVDFLSLTSSGKNSEAVDLANPLVPESFNPLYSLSFLLANKPILFFFFFFLCSL